MFKKKTFLLIFFLIILIVLILTLSLRKTGLSKPLQEKLDVNTQTFLPITTSLPKSPLPATSFPPVNLNPSVNQSLTKPSFTEGDVKVFRITPGKSKCEPSQIIVETGDKIRLSFEGLGGFKESQIKGILSQEDVLRTTASNEVTYELKALQPVDLQLFCKEFEEDPDKFGNFIIKEAR